MMNPITQMKQQNAQRKRAETAVTLQKAESKVNPQATDKPAHNRKQGDFFIAPQVSRMFDQANADIEHCKTYFPDSYHHKHQLAKECKALAARLKNGGVLLAQLVETVGYHRLTAEQKAVLNGFQNACGYVVANFKATAKHVKAVESGTATRCYAERFQPTARRQSNATQANPTAHTAEAAQ